jgi:hypothetical protein
MKSNAAQEKKGWNGLLDVHVQSTIFSNMVIWGLTDYGLCNGDLNISFHPGHGGGEGNMKLVQALHLSRSESRVLAKAKLTPQTFTVINLANKAKIMKKCHRVA